MIERVDHIVLTTRDKDACIRFYSVVLGMDLVRFDCKAGACGVCAKYCGKAYTLRGETPELPDPPPLPICPACRHTLNLLTPFYMQSLDIDLQDLVDEAQPFVD